MNPKPRSCTSRLIVPFATSPNLRGPRHRDPFGMESKFCSTEASAVSQSAEPAAPASRTLELACRRLEGEYLVSDRGGERPIGGQHQRGQAAALDHAAKVSSEHRRLSRRQRRIRML